MGIAWEDPLSFLKKQQVSGAVWDWYGNLPRGRI